MLIIIIHKRTLPQGLRSITLIARGEGGPQGGNNIFVFVYVSAFAELLSNRARGQNNGRATFSASEITGGFRQQRLGRTAWQNVANSVEGSICIHFCAFAGDAGTAYW